MAKSKAPTPQELYRANKQREEQEKAAFLPPGLVNHGNTCFMNSVLQGLIATRLLSDLAHFDPIPSSIQQHYSPAPATWRSPLLTNGRHKLGGRYEKGRVDTMPIGDVFLDLMVRAWQSQSHKKREILSPKPLLGILGRKYEQYLDFAQQDAHEFLRILLDATRMEEFDVIKKRQPPPENAKKRRRTTITPSSMDPSSPRVDGASTQPRAIPEEEKLMTLADMIFGGKFASILVCQKCKHVSQTYEDFNDISLSIKAEDYHERKRDRLKNFAKRFASFPTSSLGVNNEIPRPSSVPPSPRERESQLGHEEPPTVHEPRRRSIDVIANTGQNPDSDQSATASKDPSASVENAAHVVVTNGDGIAASEGKHIEIASATKPERKDSKDDAWTKIGRRISMTVGLGRSSKERKSRSRDRTSKDLSRASVQVDAPQVTSTSSTSAEGGASTRSTPRSSASEAARGPSPSRFMSSPLTNGHDPTLSPRTPSPRPTTPPRPRHSFATQRPHVQRGKSPKPPKPSPAELNYLREILADITPTSSSNPFNLFKPPYHQPNTSNRSVSGPAATQNLWLMNHFSGIEECLRMFTSVEILDGENMVGCRRCWKIANGEYEQQSGDEGNGDEDSDSVDHGSVDSHPAPVVNGVAKPPLGLSPLRPPATTHIPTSMSTPTVSFYSHANTSDDRSVSSLPTTEASSLPEIEVDAKPSVSLIPKPTTPGGLPIPHISTTGPDSPTSRSQPAPINVVVPPPQLGRSSSSPAPIVQPTPRLGQVLNHIPPPASQTASLPLPKSRSPLRPDFDTTEESSGAESDTSAATSTRSMESSASTSHPSNTQAVPGTVRKKPKQPKPVIMRPAYKRYLIGTPPPVLVIHLKRFQQISKTHLLSFSHGFKKLDDFVTFPEYLDLTPYLAPRKEDFGLGKKGKVGGGHGHGHGQGLDKRSSRDRGEKCMYRLYAVVVHIGNMLGGHYVAYTALPDPQHPQGPGSASDQAPEVPPSTDVKAPRQWAYISDTIVRLTTLEEVLKAKAYICMYERI
ncbi:putative peptidase C19 [Lyophyllum shimeji]|uniref:ubiquitinyl hydrolase 1 n=1 Tax=Lyophyllum shimeji TaxID=47721 RepID=A0A9P3PMQ0_LYOSH|nr:putative peptidase C19 [Lyophyllum shimeji]